MPNTLQDYLQRYPEAAEITLLGPMERAPGRLDEPLIVVDGGTRHAPEGVGLRVGDGDSSALPMAHLLAQEKDMSDLAFVLSRLPGRFARVNLYGFLGGRLDHLLFNFGEVHRFLAASPGPVEVRFDAAARGFSRGEWSFDRHGLFSIATVASCRVGLTGACQYPIAPRQAIQPLSSLGLSNIGSGTICLHCEGPAFVLFQDDDA